MKSRGLKLIYIFLILFSGLILNIKSMPLLNDGILRLEEHEKSFDDFSQVKSLAQARQGLLNVKAVQEYASEALYHVRCSGEVGNEPKLVKFIKNLVKKEKRYQMLVSYLEEQDK